MPTTFHEIPRKRPTTPLLDRANTPDGLRRVLSGQRGRMRFNLTMALLMAVTALSLPSLIMLKRVVKMPLLVTFTGVVTLGILCIGLIFNGITHWFI